MVDQSFRDRAVVIQADSKKGGIVAHVFGMTDFQQKLRKTRQSEVVEPRRQELKKLREHLAREEREVLRRYKEGRARDFQEYGISPADYERDREKTIEKLRENLKQRRKDKIREVEKKYDVQWKNARREIYGARKEASKSGGNMAV